MHNFIEKISSGIPYHADRVIGYHPDELEKIEKLYDVIIRGDLRDFLLDMGRCDGGLLGDSRIIFYSPMLTVRDFILIQQGLRQDLSNCGFREHAKKRPFLISIESETQYFYVLTRSDHPDQVYHYDENEDTVTDTGLTFIAYMQKAVKEVLIETERRWGPNWLEKIPITRGEMLIIR